MSLYRKVIDESTIQDHLDDIEITYDVKILLAVESGSRAWGWGSDNSDLDIRFIYVNNLQWYLSVDDKHDMIEHVFDDKVDVVGLELGKALKLYKKYNLSFREWMNSPEIYRLDENFEKNIRLLESSDISIEKAICYYNYNYNQIYEHYLQHEGYHPKRFLHYLRSVLACKYIDQHQLQPPVLFERLVNDTIEHEDIKSIVFSLIHDRKSGYDDLSIIDEALLEYTKNWADYYNDYVKRLKPDMQFVSSSGLNKFLFDMVMEKYIEGENELARHVNRNARFVCYRYDILNAIKVMRSKSYLTPLIFYTSFAEQKVYLKTDAISAEVPCKVLLGKDVEFSMRLEAFIQYCNLTEEDEYTFTVSNNELQLNSTIIKID